MSLFVRIAIVRQGKKHLFPFVCLEGMVLFWVMVLYPLSRVQNENTKRF